jgi:multidrug transporter EmrE-like cation transporter
MALAGVLFFKEPLSTTLVAGILMALGGLYLLKK